LKTAFRLMYILVKVVVELLLLVLVHDSDNENVEQETQSTSTRYGDEYKNKFKNKFYLLVFNINFLCFLIIEKSAQEKPFVLN
jgi:hypothetical protein